MSDKGQTEQKGKKVSLFKQKMQSQKEEIAKQNQPQASSTENVQESVQTKNAVAFPESIKLSSQDISKNLKELEQQEEQRRKELEAKKNNSLFINPQEYEQISNENDEMLKNMKSDEIESLQKQLYSILDPGVLQRFKKRDLFKVNEHPSAINEYKQDAYGQQVDHFIKNNQDEIKRVFDIECKTPQDAVKQACFDKSGKFLLDETLQHKMNVIFAFFIKPHQNVGLQGMIIKFLQSAFKVLYFSMIFQLQQQDLENLDLERLDCFNLDLLNKLIDHPNRNFNSLAIDALERIITNMHNLIRNSNKGDFLFEVKNIKVYRLDLIYYLESELSLAFTLCRCLYIPSMTLNLNTVSCLRIYLQFLLQDELVYYKQFLYKLQHSESQKKKFKAITQIFIDENLLRQISYLINNLILGDKSEKFFVLFIDVLESLVCIDHEFFTKRIKDFGFIIQMIQFLFQNNQKEQIRAIGGKQMDDKLEFLKFELGRLDYVYENIPLTLHTFKLFREAKQQISNITFEKYNQSIEQLINEWKQMKENANTSTSLKEQMLKNIRDLLIFGEKLNFIKKINIDKSLFEFNSSVVSNTILMILELHNEKEEEGYALPAERVEIKHFLFEQKQQQSQSSQGTEQNNSNAFTDFSNTFNRQDISYLIEGLIYSEGKGIPHCYKHIIDRIVPLDVQIMFKYHYQLKEKKSQRMANHFNSMKSFIRMFISIYTELNFQMKYIILKKQRKGLSVRSSFNECFSDILRVIIIEFVEFFTLYTQDNMPELSTQQIQLSLSFIQLLSEIKQTEAFISVLNIIKQVSVKNKQNPSLKIFDSLSNFFISIKAKSNQGRLPERQRDLAAFLEIVELFCGFLQPKEDNLFFYHSELLYLRALKIFDDETHAFTQLDEQALDKLFTAICTYVDPQTLNILYNKNSDIPQKMVSNFNYNSFGNSVFTRVIFFILQKPFDLKMKKKILIDTVLSYAFLFSENCKEKVYGKESNYIKRINKPEDQKIKLKTECEEIEKFLALNEIDTTSRSSIFNKFLHSYTQYEQQQQQ